MTELEHIIKRSKAGEQSAYEWLYKKYYRVLYGIALRYCRTTFEAEDVLQEAFLKMFYNIGSFRGEAQAFEGWMKRIVQNTAINLYRSNLKFSGQEDISDHEDQAADNSFDRLFDAIEAREILSLFDELPEGYRLIINLYCIDGYSHPEISAMLGISVGTSKSQLHKAKTTLKKIIEKRFKTNIA